MISSGRTNHVCQNAYLDQANEFVMDRWPLRAAGQSDELSGAETCAVITFLKLPSPLASRVIANDMSTR